MSAETEKSSSEAALLTCEEVDDLDTPTYPNVPLPVDEQRRAFIFGQMGSAEIDGKILVENMSLVEEWLRSGKTHAKEKGTKPKAV